MPLFPNHNDSAVFEKLTAMPHSNKILPTLPSGDNIYLQAATANHTRKAYQSDIRHFESSGGPLPATTENVRQYLQKFAPQLNPRTLSRRLTALKHWHIYQGFEDPTAHPIVRKTLRGIQNIYGKPKVKASPLTPDQLQKIVSHLMQQNSFIAWRDNALLQLGYFGAFRRSELVNIHIHHIRRVQKGIEVLVPRSKTDQTGEGQYCAIPYGNSTLCPVRALDGWLEKSNLTQGAIFRAVNRWNHIGEKALTPLALTHIIKKLTQVCGFPDAHTFSSHSLRRGLATSASHRGASLQAIMRQGRWQHVSTVLGYIEEGQRFEDNAAAKVLEEILTS